MVLFQRNYSVFWFCLLCIASFKRFHCVGDRCCQTRAWSHYHPTVTEKLGGSFPFITGEVIYMRVLQSPALLFLYIVEIKLCPLTPLCRLTSLEKSRQKCFCFSCFIFIHSDTILLITKDLVLPTQN